VIKVLINQKELLKKFKPVIFKIGKWKIYKDTPIWAFFINLSMPIIGVSLAILFNFGLSVISSILPDKFSLFPLLGIGVMVVATNIVTVLLNKWYSRKDTTPNISQNKQKVKDVVFWIFASSSLFIGGILNFYMNKWSLEVVRGLLECGVAGVIIGTMLVVMLLDFTLLTFYSAAYTLQTLFSYYQGKKEGIGQVRSLEEARRRFKEALTRVQGLSQGVSSKKQAKRYFYTIWRYTVKNLRESSLIDIDAQEYLLSWINKGPDKKKKGYISKEAEERIKRFVEGWLMDLPPALRWEYLPPFTLLVTAWSEDVWWFIEKINSFEESVDDYKISVLNYFVSRYRKEWEIFVDTLSISQEDKNILLNLKGGQTLNPQLLQKKVWRNQTLAQKIEEWISQRAWHLGHTILGLVEVRKVWEEFARLCFPEAKDEEIKKLVDRKVQLIVLYGNFEGIKRSKPAQAEKLEKLLKTYPFIEAVWSNKLYKWNSQLNKLQVIGECQPSFGKNVKPGKTTNQGQALNLSKGRVIFFTDINAYFRVEEVARLPYSYTLINEFIPQKYTSDYVLYGEHIFPRRFSIQSLCICDADATWTQVVQRFLNMNGACSFYGHSAWTYKELIKAINGTPHDYPSEDIVLGMRMWTNGFKTNHKEHCLFGKSRPTGWDENLRPYAKYPAGAADLGLGAVLREVLTSKNVSIGQKMLLVFTLSFYYRKPLVVLALHLYLLCVTLLNVSGFLNMPATLFFGILGFFISQAITTQQWLWLVEKEGFWKGTKEFIARFPANFVTFIPYIHIYTIGFFIGLLGWARFKITAKGLNTGWIPASQLYGYELLSSSKIRKVLGKGRLILTTTLILSLISLGMAILPWDYKVFFWIPLVLSYLAPLIFKFIPAETRIYNLRAKRVSQLEKELWPLDKSQAVPLKISLILNIPLSFMALSSVILWRNPQLIWSLFYLMAPLVSLWTPFFYRPVLPFRIASKLKRSIGYRVIFTSIVGAIEYLLAVGGAVIGSIWGAVIMPVLGIGAVLWSCWRIFIKDAICLYKDISSIKGSISTGNFMEAIKKIKIFFGHLKKTVKDFKQTIIQRIVDVRRFIHTLWKDKGNLSKLSQDAKKFISKYSKEYKEFLFKLKKYLRRIFLKGGCGKKRYPAIFVSKPNFNSIKAEIKVEVKGGEIEVQQIILDEKYIKIWNKIQEGLKGAVRDIDIKGTFHLQIDIQSSLRTPAESVPPNKIKVSPYLARSPPLFIRQVFIHEILHLLYPSRSEEEIQSLTLKYLREHPHMLKQTLCALESHLLKAKKEWLEKLIIASKKVVVVISGEHGAKKTTTSKLLAQKFGLRYIGAGEILRRLARRYKKTLVQFLEELDKTPQKRDFINQKIDRIVQRALLRGNAVIDSSTGAFYARKLSKHLKEREIVVIRVYLTAPLKARAWSIYTGRENCQMSLEEIMKELKLRDKKGERRVLELSNYEFDPKDIENYDLVIRILNLKRQQIAQRIKLELLSKIKREIKRTVSVCNILRGENENEWVPKADLILGLQGKLLNSSLQEKYRLIEEIFNKAYNVFVEKIQHLSITFYEASVLHKVLSEKLKKLDEELRTYLNNVCANNRRGLRKILEFAFNLSPFKEGWYLKEEKAREILYSNPPTNIMHSLGYKDVESMLENEDVYEVFSVCRYTESEEWLQYTLDLYKELTPEDFEFREIKIITLDREKWILTVQHLTKKLPISDDKVIGTIFGIPIPKKEGFEVLVLRTFTRALHYLNELKMYNEYFYLIKNKENFGQNYSQLIRGYKDIVLFSPHYLAETLHWQDAFMTLKSLVNFLPSLEFWLDADMGFAYVYSSKDEKFI
ncbi:MAG: hypothetical protein B6D55_06915, partial [Candidatus Omnitrophica bacterium 4484_70.2]